MSSLAGWKKILGIFLFLLFFFLSTALPVKAEPVLNGIQKQEDPSRTRVTFMLSEATEFRVDSSGQRIDLTIEGAGSASALKALPEDGTVVRMTLIRRHQDLVVSLLLRRTPQRITTEAENNPARIVMDIHWLTDDAVRPGVAFRIADMPPRRAGAAASRFQQQSPWEGRWLEFFREYRSDWNVPIKQRLTPPPLTPVTDEQSPLRALQQYADDRQFLSLLQRGMELDDLSDEERRQRDLMMADAFLRTGSYDAGLARLEAIRSGGVEEQARVDYLTVWGETARDNAIGALLHLQMTLQDLSADHPLAAVVRLLHAETALAAAQYRLAADLLTQEDIQWPSHLESVRQIRLADARFGAGDRQQALQDYYSLVEEPLLCDFYFSSCHRAAYAALKSEDADFAQRLYRRLALEYIDEPGADLIHFAAAAAIYAAGDDDWGWIELEKVTQTYPQTEGGDRAALRLLDIRVVNAGTEELSEIAAAYTEIGKGSDLRVIREEAFFKEALTLFLAGEHLQSVQRLMALRRDYARSPLRREMNLLLSRQLPIVVAQLLDQGKDLQAVVLVEQNRELLQAGGYDRAFLNNLVAAFDRLGLFERSARVLLYLFDQSAGSEEQQDIYLPLAQNFIKRDQYLAAGDYARRYLQQYPGGEDAGALFALLIDTLMRQGLDKEIEEWLQRPDRPQTPAADIRAAAFYWRQEDFAAVVDNLVRAAAAQELLPRQQAQLAESYFRLGNYPDALRHYEHLADNPDFRSQARYRRAQVMLQQRQRGAALEQLQELTEQDNESAWGKLARDLLIQEQRNNF
ncbi:MAG: tetratricopeptide repeat protein [Pelovirga sp.]